MTIFAELRLCAPTTGFCPEPLGPPPITRRRHTSAHAHAARTTHVMTLFRARVQTACSYVVVWHRRASSAIHRYHVEALAHEVHARIVDVTHELSLLLALWRTINSNRTTTTTCPLGSLSCRNAILCDGGHCVANSRYKALSFVGNTNVSQPKNHYVYGHIRSIDSGVLLLIFSYNESDVDVPITWRYNMITWCFSKRDIFTSEVYGLIVVKIHCLVVEIDSVYYNTMSIIFQTLY